MKSVLIRFVSAVTIIVIFLTILPNDMLMKASASADSKKLASTYFNETSKYLHLGDEGADSFNFNIKKAAKKPGASYSWYVKADKGNPNAVTINKKNGVVIAKEVGTAYIRCKITFADKSYISPEAKVTVRNNITGLKINNLPDDMTISAGLMTDFNRSILNTEAGKGKKTDGITRWEIKDDTAGVGKADDKGIVYPKQKGEFKIRALSFQSKAKYKLWLDDKDNNEKYITASSDWHTIMVKSSDCQAIYVSPTGRSHATGRYEDPLDLQTVLSSDSPAKPGDLVVLKEGKYSGRFVSNVRGALNSSIVFAGEPGKRVIIEGIYKEGEDNYALFLNESSWVEFRDLEITSSSSDRSTLTVGIQIYSEYSKIINCVIHDTAQAIFSSSSAINNELYGNIFYNNGFYSEAYGRGRGHGIYIQNEEGTKRIANNILFFGYGFGIHAYTESGSIKGLDFERNVWFRAGASIEGSDLEGTSDGMLIGGATPVDRTRVIENYSWSPKTLSRNIRLGWGSTVENEYIELKDNYLVGNIYVQGTWKDGAVKNNHFYGQRIDIWEGDYPSNMYSSKLPDENKIVLHKNEYEPDRTDLIIYNWEDLKTVSVSLDGFLSDGKKYEIHSVYDLWGEPVASGIYSGGTIQVPMGTKQPIQPIGYPNAITDADDPGRSFGVFIIRILKI